MRGRGWIRDILSHLVILGLLGAGLLWLQKKAGQAPAFAGTVYLDKAFLAAFVLYGLMVLIFLFQLFSSIQLERFSPGNPDSVRRLDRIRRFRLPARQAGLQERWPDYRGQIRAHFSSRHWERAQAEPFDAIMTRKRKLPAFGRAPLVDRVYLFYHPMLNVIIVDQILKECERTIDEWYADAPAPRNRLIFFTDMKNREEVTSAGAGIVNYLCTAGYKTSLYPTLIDLDGGRFFYPLDTTLIPRRHRLHYWRTRLAFRLWIRKQPLQEKHPVTEEA